MENPPPVVGAASQGGGTTSIMRTIFNGINTMIGVGILSVPFALAEGGWVALVLLFGVAAVYWYTGVLLKRCMDSHPTAATYPDIVHVAFGFTGRALISAIMYLELYMVAVEYLIMEGDNLHKLFPDMHIGLGRMSVGGKRAFVLLTALIILPTTWMKNLGLMSYVSACGVFASGILAVCVFWVGAFDGVGFEQRGTAVSWPGVPTAISLFNFCFCGHSVFPTLYHSMQHRAQFPKVLLVCFLTSNMTYAAVGVMGYRAFGAALESQITLNLLAGKWSSNIAIYTTLINPLAKYALIITPIADSIEGMSPKLGSRFVSIGLRSAIVGSTAMVAITVPFFKSVMAFTGAFLTVASSIILPCVFYWKINLNTSTLELIGLGSIVIIASLVSGMGTYVSVRDIVTHL